MNPSLQVRHLVFLLPFSILNELAHRQQCLHAQHAEHRSVSFGKGGGTPPPPRKEEGKETEPAAQVKDQEVVV